MGATKEPELHEVMPDALRFSLVSKCPYYASIVYRLRPIKVEGLRTFGVTKGWHWMYGDLVPFDREEQVAVLYHEINHLLRKHHPRQGDRGNEQWNLAGDMEINDWFPSDMKVPQNLILPSAFQLPDGELAEFYYHNMPVMEYHVREDATPMDPGHGKCKSHSSCDSKDVEPQAGDGKGKKPVVGKYHGPVCGGAAGNPNDNEPGEGKGEGKDGNGDAPAVTPIESEAIRRDIARQVSEEASRNRGNMPAGLVRWAKELLNPKVPWQKLLRTQARKAAQQIAGYTDQTWTRPPRRSVKPFILPKRIAHKAIPAFYVDTSGSVTEEMVNQALAEVRAAVRTGAGLTYVTCVDAAIYDTTKVQSVSQLKRVKIRGGGGTDMRLCFDHYKTLKPEPNLLIIITDGYTPWPEEAPRGNVQTIVVLTEQGTSPDWATTINISEAE